MADEIIPAPNGADPPAAAPEPKQSLREIAEKTWDDLEAGDAAGDQEGDQAASGQTARQRDSLGRFAPADQVAKTGVAEPDGTQPRTVSAPQQQTPHPAPQGSSSEAPANWSAQDRDTFAKLPKEGQDFLLRRHSEMEGDYQRRVQANATAAQFTAALAPVFQDPVIDGSLRQAGASPYDAIREWASFHKRAMDPNPQVRMNLLQELGQRMGLDPAAGGNQSRSGPTAALSEADLKDPAIKFFADHQSKAFNEIQALRNDFQQLRQADAARQNAEVLKVTRWSIDAFAEEKDSQGNLLHPHFDTVLPRIMELYRAQPDRDLKEAYETAVWMDPTVRQGLLTAQQQAAQQKQATQRAQQAVRSNVRGQTSPVSKPTSEKAPKGLRETIEAAAEEIGL